MNYSAKIEYLKIYVNTGLNFKAKDFINNEFLLTQKNNDYDKTVKELPEVTKYINNLLIMYRKQFPKSDKKIQTELNLLANERIKIRKATKLQFTLF